MREEKRMEMKSLMRPNTIENQSTEEDFWRDLAFKNETEKSDDGGGKEKKKQVREKKEIIVLECHEKAQVVLDRRDMERTKEEDGVFFGEVLQRRSNFTLSN